MLGFGRIRPGAFSFISVLIRLGLLNTRILPSEQSTLNCSHPRLSAIVRTHKSPIYVSHPSSHHPFFHPSTVSPSHEMNTTQSTGDPLPDVSPWELWGVIWLGYVSAAGLVVLIYDTLLTLDDEVRLIFSYFVASHRLFVEPPCLARAPFLAKSTLLHQSLPIHSHFYLFKLP